MTNPEQGKEEDTTEVSMDEVIVEQLALLASVETTLKKFKKDGTSRKTEAYHHARLDCLTTYHAEFRNNHRVLIRQSKNAIVKKSYLDAGIWDRFEEEYLEAVVTIRESLQGKQTTAEGQGSSGTSTGLNNSTTVPPTLKTVPLPEVKLSTFCGDFIEWPAFKEIFEDRVHNNENLSDLQRFHYLKSVLSGDAAQDIQHITLVGENYPEAWKMMCERYDNKRILFTHYMDVLDQQPNVNRDDPTSLKHFIQTCRSCVNSIKKLGVTINDQDQILVYYMVKKLPISICAEWDRSLRKQSTIPIFSQLCSLLDEQYLMMVTTSKVGARQQQSTTQPRRKPDCAASYVKGNVKSMHTMKKSVICPVCETADHPVRECQKFIEMSVVNKRAAVEKYKLCFNCLGYNHTSSKCSSRRTCGLCGGKHHTLIHLNKEVSLSTAPTTATMHVTATQNLSEEPCTENADSTLYDEILPTAIITVKSATNQTYQLRALLDQGSQATFLSERAAQLLGLPREKARINISGLSEANVTTGRFCASIIVGSRLDAGVQYKTLAYILPKICGILPSNKIITTGFDHLSGLQLADPEYFEPHHIDVLLGNDVYDECILSEVRRGDNRMPIAQKTTFGYIISGKNVSHFLISKGLSYLSINNDIEFDNMLRKFWDLESIGDFKILSNEDTWCEGFYQNTHKRTENGKYLVRLPLKSEFDSTCFIGKSKSSALKRFLNLENRLMKDPDLKKIYSEQINDYLKLGQMKPVLTTEEQNCIVDANNDRRLSCCYLPHHPVVKESAASTKVRIVFDASNKTTNGKALNDILVVGPPLQQDLTAVLTNWRTLKYVFMADIEKMFRCIDVVEEDAQYQRILWREEPNQPIREYFCSTVMFGTASAPYTAIRTVHQIAQDEGDRFPIAAKVVKQQMYVDDILSGGDTLDAALHVRQELISMLQSASFELRKWASNDPILLENIPSEHRHVKDVLEFKQSASVKALGLYWDPFTDEFKYQIGFKICAENPTKRTILSNIARLFDPLGWLNPIVMSAKLMMQQLWISKIGWDTPVPDSLQKSWKSFADELPLLEQLRVPRWLTVDITKGSCELHLFCDASNNAYSAVAYLRGLNEKGQFSVNLIMAKCKVNPIKPKLTIPRAELCGALLASKLLKFIMNNFCISVEKQNIFMWTDASIVLHWIRGDPSRWKTFVSNRISKILEVTSISQWRHIDSENNPADISSRGSSPSQLANCHLWWRAPTFLQLPFHEWPKSTFNTDPATLIENEKRKFVAFSQVEGKENEVLFLKRWSSFSLLTRVVAYCIRFGKNCRSKDPYKGFLTAEELQRSVNCIVGMTQREAFPEDWRTLSSSKPLRSNSSLRSLNPYFDEDKQIIRVGGRLENSFLSMDQMHPYILPAKHHVTDLIVAYSHMSTLHGGVTLTLCYIRRRFWILNGRNVVRSVIHRCIICFKHNPKPCVQLMGNLPAERVRPARAFSSTGVDYAGPFNILPSKGRGRTSIKGYVSLFICLSTKAMHLELVGDLTADAFIGAHNRFIARRGLCSNIYSDCGINFIGANRKLQADREAYQHFINKNIFPHLAERGVQWHFIPPSSPHFGGLWEAGVKSVKYHLKRTIGEQKLTYEEFNTVLAQIESCLNSRPLCPLNSDTDDLMILTPGHFLVGDTLLALPVGNNEANLRDRWLHGQNLVQQFWRKWSNEYLSRLQSRPKWLKVYSNLKVNDVVLIKDERYPCNRWPLARIVELHPGTDNIIRVVTVKTQNCVMKRPIVKICPLPISDNWNEISKSTAQ